MWRCDYSYIRNKAASCWTKQWVFIVLFFFVFRLNIPPFVSARSVFELLESEEFCENKLPVKAESGDTKVNKRWPQSSVFHIIRRPASSVTICDTLCLLLAQDARQKETPEGERGEGRSADAVPHGACGGGESGWVQCLRFCTVWLVWAAWLWVVFLNISGGTFYDPEKADYSDFKAWLQCYCVDGMKSVWDHNGRTIWFKVSCFFFFF